MDQAAPDEGFVRRHPLPVRIAHWLNLLFFAVMLGSGLQIFNAHPELYFGDRSDPGSGWLALSAAGPPGQQRGIATIAGHGLDTTGLLGLSRNEDGRLEARGFPAWATLPGPRWLAMGRRWHLFFAWAFVLNGLGYLIWSLASGHLRRDLLPGVGELRGLGASIREHLDLRRLRAASERGYNGLQKLSYLTVVLLLAPLMLLTGMAMSPRLDSLWPWLPELFGGRQSARSIHFLAAFALVGFVVVHVLMVLLVGPVRHLRAMVTGWLPPRGVQ